MACQDFSIGCVYLIVHHPAYVFEVAVIEECSAVELHPRTQFLCTHGADLWQHVPVDAQAYRETDRQTDRHRHRNRYTEGTKSGTCTACSKCKAIAATECLPMRIQKGIHRYLLRNTPLKMVSMMLSISDLFSCSCKRNHQDDSEGAAAVASDAILNLSLFLNLFCNK